MSFSLEVKKELSKLNTLADKKNVKTELLGYMATNNVSVQKNKIKFSTESEYNINRFGKLLNNLGLNDHNIKIQRSVYSITINKNYIEELTENNNDNKSDDLEKAFIRGAFLGSGTINNPEKKYHLEISLRNLESAKYILEILKKYNIDFKILEKAKGYSIYTKDGEQISKFLALIGASTAVLKFEEIRVYREIRNNVNRKVNCETANLNKTVEAAIKQIEDINFLKQIGQFEKMPEQLQEVAELRIKNPEATLSEIGKMLSKPIGKSGVNHRFQNIEQFVSKFKQ